MADLNALLNEYQALERKIFEHFGYEEGWSVFPLADHRGQWWYIERDEVIFQHASHLHTLENVAAGKFCKSEIHSSRHIKSAVMRTERHTMICVDTCTDGNKFLAIFDNEYEVKEPFSTNEW